MKEFYGMDTAQDQFMIQDFYHQFVKMTDSGDSIWKKKHLDKKRIVWLNPNNGFSIAALQELDYEIKLPNALSTFEENFSRFKSIWMK